MSRKCVTCGGILLTEHNLNAHKDTLTCVAVLKQRLAAAEADARRWRYVRDNATLAGETQDGVYLWEFEALDMNPDSIEADVDASIEGGGMSEFEDKLVNGLKEFADCAHKHLKCEKCGAKSKLFGWMAFCKEYHELEQRIAAAEAVMKLCLERASSEPQDDLRMAVIAGLIDNYFNSKAEKGGRG